MQNLKQQKMKREKMMKLRASALLSSVLVLTTCLLFLQFYQETYCSSMQNNTLLIEYLCRY